MLLQYAGSDNIIFVDAGSYILTETITIPAGAKIVGEGWPQLVAFGPKFQDEKWGILFHMLLYVCKAFADVES